LPASFSSVGLTDEKVVTVFVGAEGDILGSDNVNEEIESRLYTKEELRNLINECSDLCSRSQLVSFWIASK